MREPTRHTGAAAVAAGGLGHVLCHMQEGGADGELRGFIRVLHRKAGPRLGGGGGGNDLLRPLRPTEVRVLLRGNAAAHLLSSWTPTMEAGGTVDSVSD